MLFVFLVNAAVAVRLFAHPEWHVHSDPIVFVVVAIVAGINFVSLRRQGGGPSI